MDTKTYGDGVISTRISEPSGEDIGSLDVVVRVELGEIKLTVEQAAALVPGRILSFDRDVDTSVFLRVGDKRIAGGELVECDDQMAVEIKEIL